MKTKKLQQRQKTEYKIQKTEQEKWAKKKKKKIKVWMRH